MTSKNLWKSVVIGSAFFTLTASPAFAQSNSVDQNSNPSSVSEPSPSNVDDSSAQHNQSIQSDASQQQVNELDKSSTAAGSSYKNSQNSSQVPYGKIISHNRGSVSGGLINEEEAEGQ